MSVTQKKKGNRGQIVFTQRRRKMKMEEKKFFMFIVYTRLIILPFQIGEVSSLGKICLLPLQTILNEPKTNLLRLLALITSIIPFFKDN